MTLPIAWCLTVGVLGVPWTLAVSWLWVTFTPRSGVYHRVGFVATVLGAAVVVCGFVGALIAWIWSAVP